MNIAIFGRQPPEEPPQKPHLTELQREYLRAVTTEEERLAAIEREREAAEAEYRNSIDGRLEPYREGDVPDSRTLGIKTTGLPPARAEYVRFCEWTKQRLAETTRLEGARSRLLSALGAPEVTRRELDSLRKRDQTGFTNWVLSGALGEKYTVDAYRRSQIEAQLAQETAEAEASRAGLGAVDDELAFAKRVVEVLEARREAFARTMVVEAAEAKLQAYDAAIATLQSLAVELAGMREALDRRHVGPAREIDVALPQLGHAEARLSVNAREIEMAARPWRQRLRQVLEEPNAKLEGL